MTEVTPLWRAANLSVEQIDAVRRKHQIPPRVVRWLLARDIHEERLTEWLQPKRLPLTHPEQFDDMKQAVHELQVAVQSGTRIAIVGDYDVDGVTASAIVASTLKAIGADWVCLIPHRIDDGYGLSCGLVDRAIEAGCGVIVTVDNGIRAFEAIEYATANGLRVVLTDHHEPDDELPTQAVAVVHHVRSKSPELAHLSGAGVAWKLALALLDASHPHALSDAERQTLHDWLIGLAALGAVADVMPMSGENRRLVHEGVQVLRTCRRPGWLKLCEISAQSQDTLTAGDLSWTVIPRLNASGRMGSAQVAFDLLMTDDEMLAQSLAQHVDALNDERKTETVRVTEEAVSQMGKRADPSAGIVAYGQWHPGVAGIVAAKLVQQFQVPAIVLTEGDAGLLKGSGRAPEGYPLYDVIFQCRSVLTQFGGHDAAVGLALSAENLEAFRSLFEQAAMAHVKNAQIVSSIRVADDYLPLSEATLENGAWVSRLGPYGPGYPEFRFFVGPLQLISVTTMGAGKHARLRVQEGTIESDLIWFGVPEEVLLWKPGMTVAAVVYLGTNVWRGRSSVQLRVDTAVLLQQPLQRPEFGVMYRRLTVEKALSIEQACAALSERSEEDVRTVLDSFVELGFAQHEDSAYHVVEQANVRDLRDSLHYQRHLRSVMRV